MTGSRPRGGQALRGRLTVSRHTGPLVQQFFGHLNADRTTIEECAARAGFGLTCIKRWRTMYQPKLANFEAALNVLDLELVIVPRGTVLPSHVQSAKARAMRAVRYREHRPRKPKQEVVR